MIAKTKLPPEYLCQVNDCLSCGTCCGLYNINGLTREHLISLLRKRTETFARVKRDMKSILDFRDWVTSSESQTRPKSDFHHCPFMGLIGLNKSTVGCLLHPLGPGNKGVDQRGLSYYGGLACNVYFCPSHHYLNDNYKKILKAAVTDWYLYGLVTTEKAMIETFFAAVEAASGQSLTEEVLNNPHFLSAVSAFFELKLSWPYRLNPKIDHCHFSFGNSPEPPIYTGQGTLPQIPEQFETILKALNTSVSTEKSLEECLHQIHTAIKAAADCL